MAEKKQNPDLESTSTSTESTETTETRITREESQAEEDVSRLVVADADVEVRVDPETLDQNPSRDDEQKLTTEPAAKLEQRQRPTSTPIASPFERPPPKDPLSDSSDESPSPSPEKRRRMNESFYQHDQSILLLVDSAPETHSEVKRKEKEYDPLGINVGASTSRGNISAAFEHSTSSGCLHEHDHDHHQTSIPFAQWERQCMKLILNTMREERASYLRRPREKVGSDPILYLDDVIDMILNENYNTYKGLITDLCNLLRYHAHNLTEGFDGITHTNICLDLETELTVILGVNVNLFGNGDTTPPPIQPQPQQSQPQQPQSQQEQPQSQQEQPKSQQEQPQSQQEQPQSQQEQPKSQQEQPQSQQEQPQQPQQPQSPQQLLPQQPQQPQSPQQLLPQHVMEISLVEPVTNRPASPTDLELPKWVQGSLEVISTIMLDDRALYLMGEPDPGYQLHLQEDADAVFDLETIQYCLQNDEYSDPEQLILDLVNLFENRAELMSGNFYGAIHEDIKRWIAEELSLVLGFTVVFPKKDEVKGQDQDDELDCYD